MNSRPFCTVLALALALGVAVPAAADHHEAEEMEMGPIGPPAELRELAYLEGNWDVKMKVRMGPDAPWTESVASASVMSALGGGVLHMKFEGEFAGRPMTGFQIYSYDREEKRYESIWIDNFACRTSHMAGQIEDGNLVMSGEDLHMGKTMHMRMVQTPKSKDEFDWTMENSWEGENWYQSMAMTYTRK